MDWQPIETAPKDGTVILVYEKPWGFHPDHLFNSTHVVRWFDGERNGWGRGWMIAEYQNLGKNLTAPLFWMPLPEPPDQMMSIPDDPAFGLDAG